MRELFLFLVLALSLQARADVVRGVVVDAATGAPLPGAMVSLSMTMDFGFGTSVTTYNHDADSLGHYSFSLDNDGRCTVVAMMIGYKNSANISVYAYGKTSNDTITMDTLRLKPTELMLRGVMVSAQAKRFTMSGDTIVFHPEAFKLEEGSRLEELIRKLPGIENKDGKLFWNGKPIRMIMNGKDVFGSNADILGQLPVEAVSKIKAYDKASDLERRSGNKDGDEDHVLDINIKPGFMDKWYGKAEAAYVTEKRYDGSLEATYLSDHDPFFVFLNANNRNKDVRRSKTSGSESTINNFGKQQFGNLSYQHTSHPDFLKSWQDNRFSVNGNVLHSDGWSTSNSVTENFMSGAGGSDNSSLNSQTSNRTGENTHRVNPQMNFMLVHHADTLNTFDLQGNIGYEKKDYRSYELSARTDDNSVRFGDIALQQLMDLNSGDSLYHRLVNRERYYNTSLSDNFKTGISFAWTHNLGTKGEISTNANADYRFTSQRSHSTRSLDYIRQNTTDNLYQYARSPQHNLNTQISQHFNYWLTPKLKVGAHYWFTYQNIGNKRNFYSAPEQSLLKDSIAQYRDHGNSYNSRTRNINNMIRLTADYNVGKMRFTSRLDVAYNHERLDYTRAALDTIATRGSWLVSPTVGYSFKIDRTQSIDASFRYYTNLPQLLSTIGYVDDTNPLNVSEGNPSLHRSHDHTTSFTYRKVSAKAQLDYNITLSYSKEINPTSYVIRYNPSTGVYRTRPENIRGGTSWSLDGYLHKSLGRFYFQNNLSASLSTDYGYLTTLNDEHQTPLNRSRSFSVNENPELGYDSDLLEAALFGRFNLSRYLYSQASDNNSTPIHYVYGVRAKLKLNRIIINTEISDDARTGYLASSTNGHQVMWDAGATYKFPKNKLLLSLYFDDILNQTKSRYSFYGPYQRQEVWQRRLHHVLEVKLTYRFDAKGQKK